jgi:hypothetical protein
MAVLLNIECRCKVGVEHQKQGVLGGSVSIDACLRFWKHGMHYNNKVCRCVMFNNTGAIYSMRIFFIIKYGGAFEH